MALPPHPLQQQHQQREQQAALDAAAACERLLAFGREIMKSGIELADMLGRDTPSGKAVEQSVCQAAANCGVTISSLTAGACDAPRPSYAATLGIQRE